MFAECLLAVAFQVGPFYEHRDAPYAVRPFWSQEGETTDVLWPLFTAHDTWWRGLFFLHYQSHPQGGYQFEAMPLWFNGRTDGGSPYAGLFPIYGHHPHVLTLHDVDFALWPLWMRYRMPRPSEDRWMTTHAVLFPLVHWRDDGSWGFWPLYSQAHNRDNDAWTALWPVWSWASYRADRDTSGAGHSWMFWPLAASVQRERESQTLFLPPLFSWTETQGARPTRRLRCPWPLFAWERGDERDSLVIFPLYERTVLKEYSPSSSPSPSSSVTRFGWRLVELYDDETRVFPFWVSRDDDSYFRLWPFWESSREKDGATRGRFLALFPMRWVPGVDRNWSKFWTFYENARYADHSDHALLWGIIRWRVDHE